MKKVIIISLILIIGIIGIIFMYPKKKLFEEAILLNVEEITSIEIAHNDTEVTISDPDEIEKIMDNFSELELKETNSLDGFEKTYWITIKENNSKAYGLTVHDNKQLHTFSYEDNQQQEFTIINKKDFDLSKLNEYVN
ncbi:hypothetical protein ACFSTA_19980 [Ornithinibacillus salinisoli]|uniref:DUF5301 domain-containing protein n=1 Tax=Ornithinibacillus salinisoli TaxID=1848459 RepID=A0ABW4W646_9BACI